jgi:G6PDH family F420-dependent oxidoreductase
MELGYALSSEEHPPNDLVRFAQRAEEVGFGFALISDHYHPWVDRQGHSPFVWCTIGGIAQATSRITLGTGVTCPLLRIHPAIIAQAAATAAAMMPGRFFLGLGTGENLNEHVVTDHWPNAPIRLEMLDEAIEVIRTLWQGGEQSHYGTYYSVEEARVYTLPDELPPILVAASGEKAACFAGEVSDGLISTAPKKDLVEQFTSAGGKGKPRYGQLTVCYAREEATARRTAHEWWPTAGLEGQLTAEIKTPALFQNAVATVREDDVAESIICGPDPERHWQAIEQFAKAGFDHVYVHQVGPDQEGFFRFYEREILPRVR